MINDLKLGLKLMKHGLQFKAGMIATVVFCMIGLAMELVEGLATLVGGIYTLMGSIMVYQLIQSLTCAGLVQSSPHKKRLQTSVSAICAFICTVILNTISICAKLIMARYTHTAIEDIAIDIFIDGVLMIVVLVYMAAAMKAFWLSMIPFMLVCGIGGFGIGIGLGSEWFASLNISIGTAIVLSYCAIAVGSYLMYLVSLMLYKKEFSKITFESSLKRAK